MTVTPGAGPGAPNNRPHAVRFGAPLNARILVSSQEVAGGTRVVLPTGTTQARFALERIEKDQGATVPLVLEDDCGDWSTFAGGGKSAW